MVNGRLASLERASLSTFYFTVVGTQFLTLVILAISPALLDNVLYTVKKPRLSEHGYFFA